MDNFFSVSGQISGNHCNVPVAHSFLLLKLPDSVNHCSNLLRRIRGLINLQCPCLLSLIRRSSIPEQVFLQKIQLLRNREILSPVYPPIRKFFYLVFLCQLRKPDCHLAAHKKQILHSQGAIQIDLRICSDCHNHLLCVSHKQLCKAILNRSKSRISIQRNHTVLNQL